jgi:HEAT repeat protein
MIGYLVTVGTEWANFREAMLWLTLQQLKSNDPEKRRLAVERLGALQSPRALDSLANALSDADTQVRVAAVIAIGGIEDERTMELLLGAFRDPQPEVRLAVITRLKNTESERVQTLLAGALRDADHGVRGRAARLLENSTWHPTEIEDEVWLAIARGQLKRAAGMGSIAIRPLEGILQEAGGPQVAALEALGSIPDERVIKTLVRALRSTDHTVCLAAIGALANTGGMGIVNDLAPMLKHKDHRIRAAAIETLARLDPQSQAAEFQALLRDHLWDVRCAAAVALSKAKDSATVEALIAALKDESEDVRCASANSLGRIGDARAIGPLVLALKDSETNVRKMAEGALTLIDPKWAESESARKLIPELRTSLSSSDWFVRQAAASALRQLGEDSGQTAENPGAEMATPARRRQQVVIAAFLDLLQDADSDLRLAAAQSLGPLRDHTARSPLMSALSDSDPAVRRAASESLANLGVE